MPLEFYHSFCIVWIPLQHKHLVLTIFVYYPISDDNQRIEHTVQVGAVLELITVEQFSSLWWIEYAKCFMIPGFRNKERLNSTQITKKDHISCSLFF